MLFAPLAACAAPVGAGQAPANQQEAAAQAPARTDSAATAPVTAPTPASQEIQDLPKGATTTGRPATPPRPAPSGPVSTPLQSTGAAPAEIPAESPAVTPAPAAGQPAAVAPAAPVAVVPAPVARPPQIVMPASSAPSPGSLLETILALALVVGLLLGLAWLMKRYGPRAMGASANLKVIGALNLGGRERIMVVEVGDQWIVVGASPGRVNALATMPRQEGVPKADTQDARTVAPGSFGDWLKNTIDKRNAK